MPFEELPHTADWALRVWAPDLAGLLTESARGLAALTGAQLASGARLSRRLQLEAADGESLLVVFLGELVYLAEQAAFGAAEVQVLRLEGAGPFRLEVELHGGQIQSMHKAIKAVTYHNLRIRRTARGLEVELVFDV